VHSLIPFLADDLAAQRRAEAARHAVARSVVAGRDPRRASMRRRLALGLAAVSRTTAGAARRLDGCLPEELGPLASGR
jgi:hypothetical protein